MKEVFLFPLVDKQVFKRQWFCPFDARTSNSLSCATCDDADHHESQRHNGENEDQNRPDYALEWTCIEVIFSLAETIISAIRDEGHREQEQDESSTDSTSVCQQYLRILEEADEEENWNWEDNWPETFHETAVILKTR